MLFVTRILFSHIIKKTCQTWSNVHTRRFGFDVSSTMVDGLWAGSSSLTKDFPTVVWRLKLLGYNTIRLPFSFQACALPGVYLAILVDLQVVPAPMVRQHNKSQK